MEVGAPERREQPESGQDSSPSNRRMPGRMGEGESNQDAGWNSRAWEKDEIRNVVRFPIPAFLFRMFQLSLHAPGRPCP